MAGYQSLYLMILFIIMAGQVTWQMSYGGYSTC